MGSNLLSHYHRINSQDFCEILDEVTAQQVSKSDKSKYFEKTLSDLKIAYLTKLAQNLESIVHIINSKAFSKVLNGHTTY